MSTLKERAGKLGAFARGSSGNRIHKEDQTSKPSDATVQRPETPPLPTRESSRQEMAEAARVMIPPRSRNPGVNLQDDEEDSETVPQTSSPVRKLALRSTSPQKAGDEQEEPKAALFAGSQLGDDFMLSGPSTPYNEPSEGQPTALQYEDHRVSRERESPRRPYRHQGTSSSGHFLIMNEGGMMKVGNHAPQQNVSRVADGFLAEPQARQSKPNRRNHYNDDNKKQTLDEPRAGSPRRRVVISKHQDPRNVRPSHQHEVKSRPAIERDMRWHTTHQSWDPGHGGLPRLTEGQVPREEENYDYDGQEEEGLHTTPKASKTNGQTDKTELGHARQVTAALNAATKKRRRVSLDYDDVALSLMTFADLQGQSFDADPTRIGLSGQVSSETTLEDKLEQHRNQGEEEQRELFGKMPVEDWEASGDWFIEQFADLMRRFKEARQSKRRVISTFEKEAASREEAVRHRSEGIDRKLAKMKQDGQKVVGEM